MHPQQQPTSEEATRKRLLDYVLREVQNAVRVMIRTRCAAHVFNYGTAPDGTKYVMVMQIIPESVLLPLGLQLQDAPPTQEEKDLTDASLRTD